MTTEQQTFQVGQINTFGVNKLIHLPAKAIGQSKGSGGCIVVFPACQDWSALEHMQSVQWPMMRGWEAV
jgi:hypothetical protein